MPIVIGARRESDFSDPIGMLSDCHRRIEMFLDVLVRAAEQARDEELSREQRIAVEHALRYFREAAPKHTADEEESLFPRLREAQSADMDELMARVESLQKDHLEADRNHLEVDRLGSLWLAEGKLQADDASRLAAVLWQLRVLYAQHIHTEEYEVFPAATAVLSQSDREAIGQEMADRRRKCS